MIQHNKTIRLILLVVFLVGCKKGDQQLREQIKVINLKQGGLTLCAADNTKFGTIDFDMSCAENVRENFNLATALLHSFEYEEAEKMFANVINQDPQCVMAYWGVAMSNFHTLWAKPEIVDLKKGSQTIAIARSIRKKTERESDYLEAIGAFYDEYDKLEHGVRVQKFETAMERLHEKYPNDKEATIFYALALNATAKPTDKTFSHQLKAGAMLNAMFPNEPNHPGVAHYIIHNYDYPEIAITGLQAARAYASVAPASAHAQHMPSHIFTRLGLWDESMQSNIQSIDAAQCYASNMKMKGHWDEELHGMDYLIYAYLQRGKDEKAKGVNDALLAMTGAEKQNAKSAYDFAAIPARYAVERKQWSEAAALTERPANFPWDKFPWENSVTHFAKLLGYVHLNKSLEAAAELKKLKANEDKLLLMKDAYHAGQVRVQIDASEAWLKLMLLKGGKKEEVVEKMTWAAYQEDRTAKPPVTPGEIVPARELLGDLLMELNEPAKALVAYEESLKTHPGRFNSLSGAAAAARLSNNSTAAKHYFDELLKVADLKDSKRAVLTTESPLSKTFRLRGKIIPDPEETQQSTEALAE